MDVPRVLLIVPCYNEQESIASVLREIAICGNYAVIVIDDGSCDGTFQTASKLAPTVRLLRNLGIGGAVQTGLKYGESQGYDICIQIDGDGQHPPSEIEKLLDAYQKTHLSIIVGSRYLLNDSFRSTSARRMGSYIIARFLHLLFPNFHLSDPTSGMRLMDRRAIEFFSRQYPADFPEPISLAWALQNGLSIGEVSVKMRAREHGNSSIFGLRSLTYMIRVLGNILLTRISGSPSK